MTLHKSDIVLRRLNSSDISIMQQVLDCFSNAFEDPDTYSKHRPNDAYLSDLLNDSTLIVLAAFNNKDQVVGALAAYELKKIEQCRSEIYIYDLAVDEAFRRQGIATSLIQHLQPIAAQKNAWVIYVQADYIDPPAVALYSKLGEKEEVMHFDIPVRPTK